MKKIILIAFVAMFAVACGNKKIENKDDKGTEKAADPSTINSPATADDPAAAIRPDNAPAISFENEKVTIPAITEGESVEVVFKYTNSGKSNLVLSAVEPTCGCTVADEDGWSKEPLAPGESEKIKVVYNSEGKGTGLVTKSVVVRTNAPAPNNVKEVKFSVQVTPKK